MNALVKLVAQEESGKPPTLWKDFDRVLEEQGLAKSLSLYFERCWTKMGYTAGALLECVPILRKILSDNYTNIGAGLSILSRMCLHHCCNEGTRKFHM